MKKLLLAAVLVVAGCARVDGRNECVQYNSLIDADLQSSRSFTIDRNNNAGMYGLLTVFVNHDANAGTGTVTQIDMDCTGSLDANVTDFEFQATDDSATTGTFISSDTTWQKTVAAADQWIWRLTTDGVPDIQCTFSVGAGTGGTSGDTIDISATLCTK